MIHTVLPRTRGQLNRSLYLLIALVLAQELWSQSPESQNPASPTALPQVLCRIKTRATPESAGFLVELLGGFKTALGQYWGGAATIETIEETGREPGLEVDPGPATGSPEPHWQPPPFQLNVFIHLDKNRLSIIYSLVHNPGEVLVTSANRSVPLSLSTWGLVQELASAVAVSARTWLASAPTGLKGDKLILPARFLSADEGAQLSIPGHGPVGQIEGGSLVVPAFMPVDQALPLEIRKPGFHPLTTNVVYTGKDLTLPPLVPLNRFGIQAYWDPATPAGGGLDIRYFPVSETIFIGLDFYLASRGSWLIWIPADGHGEDSNMHQQAGISDENTVFRVGLEAGGFFTQAGDTFHCYAGLGGGLVFGKSGSGTAVNIDLALPMVGAEIRLAPNFCLGLQAGSSISIATGNSLMEAGVYRLFGISKLYLEARL